MIAFSRLPLTANSVQRAGSNFQPRSDPRSELRRGPDSDSADSFPERFESSSLGNGGTRKIRFSGIGLFVAWHWSCVWYFGAAVAPMDDVQKCFSYWSVCARRKPCDVHWRICRRPATGAMPQGRLSNFEGCGRRLGAALDRTPRAGRTDPVDPTHIGSQADAFKLPDQVTR